MPTLSIHQRLDALIPSLLDKRLLNNRGIGNEIGFYIFDYEPEYEPLVQQHINHLKSQLTHGDQQINVLEINLYCTIIDILESRGVLQTAFDLEAKKGNASLSKAITPVVRSRQGLNEYTVRLGEVINPASLRIAKDLANDLLDITPPSDPLKLFEAYQNIFKVKQAELQNWLAEAVAGKLPFVNLLQTNLGLLKELLIYDSPAEFFKVVHTKRDDIEDAIQDGEKLKSFFTRQVKLFKQAQSDLPALELELRHLNHSELLPRVTTVRQILAMPDPTTRIPELPLLLQPVKEQIKQILAGYIESAIAHSENIKQQLTEYAQTAYPNIIEQLNLPELIQEIESAIALIKNAATIDSVIARQSELDGLLNKFKQKLDASATQIASSVKEKDASYNVTSLKTIVPVKVANLAAKSVLETTADVDDYLSALRSTLLAEIEQQHRVRL